MREVAFKDGEGTILAEGDSVIYDAGGILVRGKVLSIYRGPRNNRIQAKIEWRYGGFRDDGDVHVNVVPSGACSLLRVRGAP